MSAISTKRAVEMNAWKIVDGCERLDGWNMWGEFSSDSVWSAEGQGFTVYIEMKMPLGDLPIYIAPQKRLWNPNVIGG